MRTRKKNKSKSLLAAEQSMELFLKGVGFTGTLTGESIYEIPNYRSDYYRCTSNDIPTSGHKKPESIYSGHEIAGIVTTHKSNLMPIRKDNKHAAVDAAQMRRN